MDVGDCWSFSANVHIILHRRQGWEGVLLVMPLEVILGPVLSMMNPNETIRTRDLPLLTVTTKPVFANINHFQR